MKVSPIKGQVKLKTPLLTKKLHFFAWPEKPAPARPCFHPFSAPVTSSLFGSDRTPTRTSHPSGSRLYCYAWSIASHTAPVRCSDPENRRFHAVSNRIYYKSYGY